MQMSIAKGGVQFKQIPIYSKQLYSNKCLLLHNCYNAAWTLVWVLLATKSKQQLSVSTS